MTPLQEMKLAMCIRELGEEPNKEAVAKHYWAYRETLEVLHPTDPTRSRYSALVVAYRDYVLLAYLKAEGNDSWRFYQIHPGLNKIQFDKKVAALAEACDCQHYSSGRWDTAFLYATERTDVRTFEQLLKEEHFQWERIPNILITP